jgi:predicted DNA-binding transcriptional regulator YafY
MKSEAIQSIMARKYVPALFVTLEEAADHYDVSTRTIQRWIRRGWAPFRRTRQQPGLSISTHRRATANETVTPSQSSAEFHSAVSQIFNLPMVPTQSQIFNRSQPAPRRCLADVRLQKLIRIRK